MNYKEYQELASKTFAESGDETLNLLHCAIGASTEAGELLDAFKKHIYYKKELDVVNIGEEIADMQWYLFNLCRLLNLDMEQLLEANIAKLKARYGDKFSTERAINRDLDTERNILETGVVATENRELETGGMKPPKNNWISYSETISSTEKDKLKKEMIGLLNNEEVIIPKQESLFKLSDVESAFGYLEEFGGDFSIKLISTEAEIKLASRIADYDLSKHLDKINSVDNIAMLFCDYTVEADSSDVSRFIVLLEFNQLLGTLRIINVLANNESTSLSKKTGEELDKYLNQYGIEK
jgi:NTP pyrophosphatase (non-canonical NTP hydrolase)